MVARDGRHAFGRWPEDFLVLIHTFFHRDFERLRGRHLAVELLGAAHRAQLDVAAFEPTEARAFAAEMRGDAIAKGERGGNKFGCVVHRHIQIQNGGEFFNIRARFLRREILLERQWDVGHEAQTGERFIGGGRGKVL